MNNPKIFWLMLLVPVLFVFVTSINADVPQSISYQGRLTDDTGMPVSDTTDLTFSIFSDSGGANLIWVESHSSVVIDNGLFMVLLGESIVFPDSLFNGQPRYLGVQIDGGPMLTELVPIISAAYAIHAGSADTAAYALDAPAPSSLWTLDEGNVYLPNTEYQVAVGLTSPYPRRKLNAQTTGISDTMALWVNNTTGIAAGFYSNVGATTVSGTPSAIYARSGGDNAAGIFNSTGDGMGIYVSAAGSRDALQASTNGTAYAGRFSGGLGVKVSGDLEVTGTTSMNVTETNTLDVTGTITGYTTEANILKVIRTGFPTEVAYLGSSYDGGRLFLYDESQHSVAGMHCDNHGTGGSFYVARDSIFKGFSVDGNYNGTYQPRVSIWGSDRSAEFWMGFSGDASVDLPDSAISADEMLNEPGIAFAGDMTDSIQINLMWRTIIDSLTVTLPEAGYVYLQANCNVYFNADYWSSQAAIIFIRDSVADGSYTKSQESWVLLPEVPNQVHQSYPLSVSMVYFKPAGSHLFTLEGYSGSGGGPMVKACNANMSAIYFPTSYGPVRTMTSAANVVNFENSQLTSSSGQGSVNAGGESSGPLYKVDLRELELRAAKARAEAERAQRELLEAQLRLEDDPVE
jgi:hypothetical protein